MGVTTIGLMLLVVLGNSDPAEPEESGSDIRITGWTVESVDQGLNFTVNVTNEGDAIGAANVTCSLTTLSTNYSMNYIIELAPGKSDMYVLFLPLPENVRLSQGEEKVTIVQI